MHDNVIVVLPSLDPDFRLNLVVDGCLEQGFKEIVIVNDGSDAAHKEPFEIAAKKPGVTVLEHEVNKGKGRALKTAMSWILENRKDAIGIVTVDGDNQHHPEDIKACAAAMTERHMTVLGCRDFSEPQVPWKSKAGNNITKFVFRAFCGIKISDTQTGLRAFPVETLPMLCECEGERFEFETNMLLEMHSMNIPFSEVKIRTIYEDKENSTSHFHPFRDSFKIYKIIFKYVFSSIASTLVDLVLFFILNLVLKNVITEGFTLFGHEFGSGLVVVFLATAGARLVSSFMNYKVNKHIVFKSDADHTMLKYYILAILQMSASALLVYLISHAFGEGSVLRTLCKAVVDTALFFISFRVQKAWVFKK
ncbi:MAG: bifunctional glycosyltransferase family 2/GtrA family protein [Lachnospiraceae bacterium]|nr:bifunctional glycosyltransferase family 2/GtrA family protein [Lachnospiraceae bacterium]